MESLAGLRRGAAAGFLPSNHRPQVCWVTPLRPAGDTHTGAKTPGWHQRAVTCPQVQMLWREEVFIIQPLVKPSFSSWEGELKYGLLTESFSKQQSCCLVAGRRVFSGVLLIFYLQPDDVKLKAAPCDLGSTRRMLSGGMQVDADCWH